jgi:DNA-binding transcriptional ArsR family regulator
MVRKNPHQDSRRNSSGPARGSVYRKLERIIKGFANHRRLQILELLQHSPELSVNDISEQLGIGYMNASDHVRKLAIAGLVLKRSEGNTVRHKLTTRAESILVFCKKLE